MVSWNLNVHRAPSCLSEHFPSYISCCLCPTCTAWCFLNASLSRYDSMIAINSWSSPTTRLRLLTSCSRVILHLRKSSKIFSIKAFLVGPKNFTSTGNRAATLIGPCFFSSLIWFLSKTWKEGTLKLTMWIGKMWEFMKALHTTNLLGASRLSTPVSNSSELGYICLEPAGITSIFPIKTLHNNICLVPFSSALEDARLQ